MENEKQDNGSSFAIVSQITGLLEALNENERAHVLRTVATWFRIDLTSQKPSAPQSTLVALPQINVTEDEKFSDRQILSAKEFILEKDPVTEVERLACLAFYLTHYKSTPHFKNIDLIRLNTEAAQRKLSNPAVAISNAIRDGFFVQAPSDGFKQISAAGERFVQVLPNRDEAKQVKKRMASRRGRKSGNSSDSQDAAENDQ